MTAEIIPLGCVTRLDFPADQILEQNKGEFEGVVLLGFSTDGGFKAASSYADGGTVMWLLELCKKKLLEVDV